MIVSDFIKKYFIEEVGFLVNEHPFVAFAIMSIGVEFLGKCLNNNPWDDWKFKKTIDSFDDAVKTYESLAKYISIPHLYHNLRCGLAHRFMIDGTIKLGSDKNDLTSIDMTIGCKEFYDDFKQACLDAINNKNGMIRKNLGEEYNIEIDGITGSTKTANTTVI